MKTKTLKTICLCAVLALSLMLSSFSMLKKKQAVNTISEITLIASEYSQVKDFAYKNVCLPLMKSDDEKGVSYRSFSRCPSGYRTQIETVADSVKINKDVVGQICVYRGCSREYVCDFKVNMGNNVAVVKTKEMSDYITVAEFVESKKKTQAPAEIKEVKQNEKAKEIKG